MDIAVIVPTYNRAHLIGETLDSILAQSYAPAEVVVADDGSTDDTESVVARYAPRVRYMRIQNSGPCRARNAGVAASTAPWLAFCDSDDLWQPDRLRKQVELCSAAPDVHYCFTNFRVVTGTAWSDETKFDSLPANYWGQPLREIGPGMLVLDNDMFLPLLAHQPVFPSTLLMKRSFFEAAGGWNENLGRNPSEDIEFLFRCIVRPPLGIVTEPLVGIRKHEGNWTRASYIAAVGLIDILEHVQRTHPAARQHAAPLHRRIQELSARAARGAFAMGDLERMRQLLAAVPFWQRSWKLHFRAVLSHVPRLSALFMTGSPKPAGPGRV